MDLKVIVENPYSIISFQWYHIVDRVIYRFAEEMSNLADICGHDQLEVILSANANFTAANPQIEGFGVPLRIHCRLGTLGYPQNSLYLNLYRSSGSGGFRVVVYSATGKCLHDVGNQQLVDAVDALPLLMHARYNDQLT